MKKLSMIILSMVASTACLVGCNDDSNSVNADGTCTQQLIDDWNSMVSEYRALRDHSYTGAQIEIHTRGLNSECNNFLSQHANVSCQVSDPITNDPRTLDTSVVNETCSDAAAAVAQYDAQEAQPLPLPPVTHAPPAYDNYSPLRTVANAGVLYARVTDAYGANRLIQDGDLAVQAGNIVDSRDVSANGIYCKMIPSGTGSDMTIGAYEKLHVYMSSESEANSVSSTRVYFSGKGFALDCTKFEPQSFTVGDLGEGVSTMFSLSIEDN